MPLCLQIILKVFIFCKNLHLMKLIIVGGIVKMEEVLQEFFAAI